jgi:hypothetical protein
MNFLVDAQLPRRLARRLQEAGHDALHTLDLPAGNRTTDSETNIMHDPTHELTDGDFPRGVGAPARRALAAAGYVRLEQLTQARESELRRLHGMGPKALEALRQALAARGWSFADEADG